MSRPQLPRYSVSSTSYASFSDPHQESEAETSDVFTARRRILLDFIFSLEAGCASEQHRSAEEETCCVSGSEVQQRVAEEKSTQSVLEECNDSYSGNYTTAKGASLLLVDSVQDITELNRLELFHEILAELKEGKGVRISHHDRILQYERLDSLVENFLHEAEIIGKMILQEIGQAERTIAPLKKLGVLGGEKFLHRGIYFKLAVDKAGLLGGFEGARKVSRHEIKSLAALMDNGVEGLKFPLVCLVSYLGLSILAMTQLPISDSTLVYGSADAGKSVHFEDAESLALAEQLGTSLNLKPHQSKLSSVKVRLPIDMEIHSTSSGHYALDFSRLFPPTFPNRAIPGCQFQQLFRPEFLQRYSKPLCSDSFSRFISPDDEALCDAEIAEATRFLENLVDELGTELSLRPIPSPLGNDREYAMQVCKFTFSRCSKSNFEVFTHSFPSR